MRPSLKCIHAFTLIELLVVISIVAVLMGLAFPAFQGVQNAAKKTQAKNDLVQIVTAVNAFYTEYGKYPLAAQGADVTLTSTNSDVLYALRGVAGGANSNDSLNPKKIVFLSPPDAKDPTTPKAGLSASGVFYDPWGKQPIGTEAGVYHLAVDGDYDNEVTNPYSGTTGATPKLRAGVIAWSLGKDGVTGTDKNSGPAKDDVISWQ
jgi:prepilin-type N-terminal cleavage/methylation domain-containing protein